MKSNKNLLEMSAIPFEQQVHLIFELLTNIFVMVSIIKTNKKELNQCWGFPLHWKLVKSGLTTLVNACVFSCSCLNILYDAFLLGFFS